MLIMFLTHISIYKDQINQNIKLHIVSKVKLKSKVVYYQSPAVYTYVNDNQVRLENKEKQIFYDYLCGV